MATSLVLWTSPSNRRALWSGREESPGEAQSDSWAGSPKDWTPSGAAAQEQVRPGVSAQGWRGDLGYQHKFRWDVPAVLPALRHAAEEPLMPDQHPRRRRLLR